MLTKYKIFGKTYNISWLDIGVFLTILYTLIATFKDVVIKRFLDLPAIEILFFISLFSCILISISLLKNPGNTYSKKGNKKLLIFRSIIGAVAAVTFYYSIAHISLVKTIIFWQTQAIFSAIFAFIVLWEKLRLHQWIAILIGFGGIVLILNPDVSIFIDKDNLIGLLCGITAAMSYTSLRELRRHYGSRIIVFYYSLTGVVLSAILMGLAEFFYIPSLDFIMAEYQTPSFLIILMLLIAAGLTTIGQILKTKAYQHSKTGVVGVALYSRVLFSFVAGIFLGDGWLDMITLSGIILVTISCIMVAYKKKEPKKNYETFMYKL